MFDITHTLEEKSRNMAILGDIDNEAALAKKHGYAGPLKICHVIQTAEADLVRYSERRRIKRARESAKDAGADPSAWGTAPATCFLAKHVAAAGTVKQLLISALRDCASGRKISNPQHTRLIYEASLLSAALDLYDLKQQEKQANK